MASFAQLNFYGFRKRSNKSLSFSQFSHPMFLRGQVEKLSLIRRKSSGMAPAYGSSGLPRPPLHRVSPGRSQAMAVRFPPT